MTGRGAPGRRVGASSAVAMAIVMAACGGALPATTASLTPTPGMTPSVIPVATSTPVPGASGAATLCRPDQITLTAGEMGAAAGTNYLALEVRLVSGPPCILHAWPPYRLVEASGRAMGGSSPESASRFVTLRQPLEYQLGWASWCEAQPPVRPIRLWLGLISPERETSLELPAAFGPSGCDASGPVITVEPAFEP